MNYKLKIIGFLSMLLIANSSFAQFNKEGNWVKIAEKMVDFKSDKDIVYPIGNLRKVDKIKIKCVQGSIKLRKVRVEMTDGQKKEYDAKGVGVLTNGKTSFAFTLPGKNNSLKKIELEYNSIGVVVLSKKAKVEILGRRWTK
jgi:hypothetical protein